MGTTASPINPVEAKMWGNWQTAIDCSWLCSYQIDRVMGQELAHYFDFTGVTVNGKLTLREDGTFTMTIDEAAVQALSQQITQSVQGGLYGYLEQALAEELSGFTLDAYLNATGLTMEDLMTVAGVNMGQLVLDMIQPLRTVPCSGTYFVKDEQLHIAGTVCGFALTEDSLSIYAPVEGPPDGVSLSFPALLPLEFIRVEAISNVP